MKLTVLSYKNCCRQVDAGSPTYILKSSGVNALKDQGCFGRIGEFCSIIEVLQCFFTSSVASIMKICLLAMCLIDSVQITMFQCREDNMADISRIKLSKSQANLWRRERLSVTPFLTLIQT